MNLPLPVDNANVFRTTTRERWDPWTPIAMAGLGAFGIAFIFSAQLPVQGRGWIVQLLWLFIGAGVYVAVSLIDYRFWLGVAHWFYALCLVPLVLVLIPGIGTEVYGSQRWIHFGPVSIQPSEMAMVAVLLITASLLVRSEIGTVRQSLGVLGKLALAVGAPMLLILLQPDLKSAIVLPPMVFSMLYVSRLSGKFFAGSLGLFLLLVGLVALDTWRYESFVDARASAYRNDGAQYANRFLIERGNYQKQSWFPLHDYQRERILSFVDPDKVDPMGIGWNQRQSLISVGSGGLSGKGWTEGTQARLGYLPRSVAHNDFIFSVIAEEKGFLGSITVLSLFGLMLFNGIRIAGLSRDRFGTLLALGVTVLFLVHMFVNIAMTIGLVPITGIPLPFISYGGSFVLSCCFLQGLVQSVYRFRKDFA
ncbi:MAG TPA: FtsW/RodA/SpoVE family cell cycle protein [Opitutaceae bacterium]